MSQAHQSFEALRLDICSIFRPTWAYACTVMCLQVLLSKTFFNDGACSYDSGIAGRAALLSAGILALYRSSRTNVDADRPEIRLCIACSPVEGHLESQAGGNNRGGYAVRHEHAFAARTEDQLGFMIG